MPTCIGYLLIEDTRCILSGIPPKMIVMKKRVSFACVGNPVAEAQAARDVETHIHRSNKEQDNDIYDDDVNDVLFYDGLDG